MRARLLLITGMLAASMPAAAQQHTQSAEAGPATQVVYSARLESAHVMRLNYSRGREASQAGAPLFSPRRSSSLTAMASRNDTAFAQEVALPLLASSRGKFEFQGFFRLRATENILMGLPGSGSLPAWGVSTQSHPGVWTPMADQSFGVSLKLHLHRGDVVSRNAQGLHCIGKLWAAARSVI
jgi:hypothetical protein